MKKALKYGGIGLVGVLGLAVVVGAVRGSHWEVERSVTIQASPEQLLPLVADFESGWTKWSVWSEMDPQGKWEFGGNPGEPGHWMAWDGPEVGHGKLTLTKVEASGITYEGQIETDEPNNVGTITFEPDGDATKVTWHDEGDAPPVIGGLFKGMLEDMLGQNFEQNLEKLGKTAQPH